MIGSITTLLFIGVLAAGLRSLVEILVWGRPGPHPEPPRTTSGIAKEGLRRARRARDTSYRHFNRKVRS